MRRRTYILAGLIAASMLIQAAPKTRYPHIGYIYPAGGQVGTTVQLVVGGMNLQLVTSASVSGSGVEVVSVRFFNPFKRLNNDARRELVPILRAMRAGVDPVAAYAEFAVRQQKRLEQRKKKDAEQGGEVEAKDPTVPDIVPGERLVYIDMTPAQVVEKISAMTPLEFAILHKKVTARRNALQASPAIDLAAIVEVKIAPDAEPGLRNLRLFGKSGMSNSLVFEVGTNVENLEVLGRGKDVPKFRKVQLPITVNGQIMPGQVDYIRFTAKKGEAYSFELLGRTLIPFLGDAVPGWFQPVISIHDPSTKQQLAFADDNLFDPDPRLTFTAPADGEFELQVRDSIYRGREDFVYRIKARPGPASKTTMLRPQHANLQGKTEAEPNDSLPEANSVTHPVLMAGTIQKPGDVDTFGFAAKKGDKIVLEVFARRLNSPMDSLVRLLDAEGKVLAWNDDGPWKNIGTKTHHSDSFLMHELPADGKYFAQVSDIQKKNGDGVRYHLRVSLAQPDFSVFMDPSTINMRAGSHAPVVFHVFRREGFAGAVKIAVKEGPMKLRVSGGHVPAGAIKHRATISTPPKLKLVPHSFTLSASATINGQEVTHDVVACDETMQAFLWTHFVAAQTATIYPIGRSWFPIAVPKEKLLLHAGEQKVFTFQGFRKLENAVKNGKLRFALHAAPKGLQLTSSQIKGKRILLTIQAAEDAPDWQGNLLVDVMIDREHKRPNGKVRKFSNFFGCLPAVGAQISKKP